MRPPTMRTFNTPLKWFMLASMMATPLINSCHKMEAEQHKEEEHEESKLIVTRPLKRDTTVTREYVCQIHSRSNIEVCALERGYLEATHVKEGQRVKQGDPMFQIMPRIYQAELKRAEAEAQAAKVEYENTKRLADNKVVSDTELAISKAKLEKAQAEVNLAQTHLGFTDIKAPFPGLIDRLHLRQGSLVAEGDLLTTLSDNSEMWVYFNVPEAEYLDYASQEQPEERKVVKLVMANGEVFKEKGRVNVIEAEFNNETGTIPFRADFPNPDGLLRHGGTGNIQMNKLVKGAILIPQKSTFEVLDHHYVFVVGKDDMLTQQRVHISEEIEDLFIISEGITENDKIVLEGLRQAKSGKKAEYEFEEPQEAFKHLKLRAE
jgi:membrane fusion protein (multidrug efflux system)